MKFKLHQLAPICAVLASSHALAIDINLTGFAPGTGTIAVTYTGSDGYFIGGVYNASQQIGQMVGTIDGQSFATYCAEIFQGIAVPGSYMGYSINMPWSSAVQTNMNKLMSYAASKPLPTTAAESAAMQAAVWEVLYESDFGTAGLGFGTGHFKVTAGTADLASIDWQAVSDIQVITHTVVNLSHPLEQDLLLITAVPETSTYAMMLLGLAGMGAVVRKRRQSAQH